MTRDVEAAPGAAPSLAGDVASNVFAVLFIALIVAMLAAAGTPPSSDPIDLRTLPSFSQRRPLAAPGLVAMLHRRQSGGPGLRLDLTASRLRLLATAGETDWSLDDAAGIAAALPARLIEAGGPVDLYVFDARAYALVMRILNGRDHTELSVPAALRACADRPGSGCADGDDWSAGFRAMMGRPLDADTFTRRLADLLAAAPAPAVARGAPERRSPPPDRSPRLQSAAPAADAPQRPSGWWLVLAGGLLFEALFLIDRFRRPS